MKEKIEFIFKAAEASQVTMTDLARLTGISRETLYRWRQGRAISDVLRLNIAYQYALRLEKACRSGKLPIKDKLKKDQRLKVLRKVVAEMASNR